MNNDRNSNYEENHDFHRGVVRPRRFQIDLIPTLNRGILMSAFIPRSPLTFAIKYDKKSSALQFQLDSNSNLIKDRIVKVQMFRNLDTCEFCKLFFDMETISNESCDYRGKFRGVKPLYARHLIQFLKEKYDFHVNEKGKPSQNYMLVLGWKLQDSDNELLYYFVQRKCYNDATRINIVRTAGLQLATERGLDLLDRYITDSDSRIRKVVKQDDVPFFATIGSTEYEPSTDDDTLVTEQMLGKD